MPTLMDRRRYDSAMFWLAFGTAASVIGVALMTIGVSRSMPGANFLVSRWFDAGLGLLAIGGLLLLWSLWLYLARRRAKLEALQSEPTSAQSSPPTDWKAEAVRGYYAERDKAMKMWDRQDRNRRRKR